MAERRTLADKLDRMIADLSKLVVMANRVHDFKTGTLTQQAIEALGAVRSRDQQKHGEPDWAHWIAWPPRQYPEDWDETGLMDVTDLERMLAEKNQGKET